jgi:Fe-S-cluster containining protein
MENQMTPLAPDQRFCFFCSKRVACFNECCQNLNQYLTPYDILRLKNCLKLSSGDFLQRYTSQHVGPASGLPVISFKMDSKNGLKCPFVTPAGCSVYKDRPTSCRIYPLARAVSRCRETGKITEHFALLKESHCLGFKNGPSQTVTEWLADQGLADYNEMNDILMEIISLKNQFKPEPLDLKESRLFHLACYDLDAFRTHLFKKGLETDLKAEAGLMKAAQTDDTALLKFGLIWIKTVLFSVA